MLTAASNANKAATFEIADAKLYVTIVTLSAEDNAKLLKLLCKRFKRSIYWKKYKVIDNRAVEIADLSEEKYIRELLDSSYQESKNSLLLLIIIQKIIMKFVLIHSKNISFQELK